LSEITIIGPDGNRFVFPAGTDRETMKAAMRRRYTGENARKRDMILNSQLPDPALQGVRDYLGREQLTEDIRQGREVAALEAATGPENVAKERFYTAAQGQTLGAAPLLQGAVNVPIAAVMYPFLTEEEKAGRDFGQFVSEMSSLGYDQARGSIARAREKRPLESAGIELGAGLLTGKTVYDELGKRFLAERAGARGAAVGAGAGGQYGFLEGEGDVGQGVQGALVGAPVGAGLGKALEAVADPLGRMFRGEQVLPAGTTNALTESALGSVGGSALGSRTDLNGDGVIDEQDMLIGAAGGGLGVPAVTGAMRRGGTVGVPRGRSMGMGAPKQPATEIAQGQEVVGPEGLRLLHGTPRGDLTLEGVEIIREGAKQGKRGRKTGGFYATSVADAEQAAGYAAMTGKNGQVLDVIVKPGTRILQYDKDITRLSEQTINDLRSQNYGLLVGKDVRGRTEYVVIDKNAIESLGGNTPTTPQQAARAELPGSPEYEAAKAKGLDMSQAGRMARAKEMGFDTETVLYHGTNSENITTFSLDLPRRHSRKGEPPAVHFTTSPEEAKMYGPNVGSYYVRGKLLEIDSPIAMQEDVLRRLTNVANDYDKYSVGASERAKRYLDGADVTNNYNDQIAHDRLRAKMIKAREQGYDGVIIKGGWGDDNAGTHHVIFDPSNIRSVNAAFDPDNAQSSTLLAAAPFAVGGAGLGVAANQEDR
jgi:hypothetical protein